MKKNNSLLIGFLFTLLALVLTACSTQVDATEPATLPPTANPAPVQGTYSDPFSYCAVIGTIDKPDARYTGPQISDEIINGFIAAAGLEASTEPMEMFKKTTIWRCMDSQVYACNFGANLPCDSKANTDKIPSAAMGDYCKANPGSDFIPMSVTGHTTIYSWRCAKEAPELLEQIAKVDSAGYLAEIWYPIVPGAKPRPESSTVPPGMANPASENCVKQGGKLVIEKRGELGEFGVCYFEDNRQCEEWALLRGECPVGGLKVTGYITEAARFCAITGGEYAVTGNSGADNEQGTCTFKTGKSCDVWEYYNGTCGPNE